MTTLLIVLGTRPETIKLAPVIRAARAADMRVHVVHTGQHHDPALSLDLFAELGLPAPDLCLEVGSTTPSQHLARILERLEPVLAAERPDLVLVQGDTSSALAGALCANKLGLALGHVEAGLRSFDRRMPEEHNRVMVDHIADLLFVPTEAQRLNLMREGIAQGRIHMVGNTVADAAQSMLAEVGSNDVLARFGVERQRYLLLTLHRQENVDDPQVLQDVLAGTGAAAEAAGLRVLFPAHPRTSQRLESQAIALPPSFLLAPPCSYRDSLLLQRSAAAVLTDSGGLQEEAAILGVPCVTLRLSTERPETVDISANEIAGTSRDGVAQATARALLRARGTWQHPSGGGDSGQQIIAACSAFLQQRPRAALVPQDPVTALPSDQDRSGRTLGAEECELAVRAIRSGTLTSTKGSFVARFEAAFAERMGRKFAVACSSGSAAVHCAVAAVRPQAGSEVVTTPITDMGALTPILYEGALPVFADVDPATLNVTAKTLAAQLTDRSRAIVATHLFGLCCEMGPIRELARRRNLPLIEDAAQALLAEDPNGLAGTLGDLACFSLQQGKHMTTGEGGVVLTDDADLHRHVRLFVNKAWGYGDPSPDHYFPALNYRLTELQGAVALAQLGKLDWVVQQRRQVAALLGRELHGIQGLRLPRDPPGGRHSWWKYAVMVDTGRVPGGALALGRRLQARGVHCAPRYIQKPAFECALFQDFHASPVTALPLGQNSRRNQPQPLFHRRDYPGAVQALEQVIVLPINERYTSAHVAFVARVIREETARLCDAA